MKKLGHIAYNKINGKSPTVVFCGGFRSDMTGSKAIFLEKLCKKIGIGFVRFDYFGHGKSDGKFEDGTIGKWLSDVLKVIDELTTGKIILVGSSMGAWLGLLACKKRAKRIRAFIGIAAAPDFTEDLIWEKFDEFTQKKLQKNGVVNIPNCYDAEPYPITWKLIEEARKHLLLNKPINIKIPVRLLHSIADDDVPYHYSLKAAELITGGDVEVHIVKNSDHRMSSKEDLELIKNTLLSIVD